jgi:hypothetical protein
VPLSKRKPRIGIPVSARQKAANFDLLARRAIIFDHAEIATGSRSFCHAQFAIFIALVVTSKLAPNINNSNKDTSHGNTRFSPFQYIAPNAICGIRHASDVFAIFVRIVKKIGAHEKAIIERIAGIENDAEEGGELSS